MELLKMTKKILMIVGDFNECLETFFPYQVLKMLGHQVDTISPEKIAGDRILTAVHDLEDPNLQSYTEKRGHYFPITKTFKEVNANDYDSLVIPGGRASEVQRLDEDVLNIVRHFPENDKVHTCTCHGIQLFAAAGILKDKQCTGVPFCKPEVEMAGGIFIDKGLEGVVTDGLLVTGATWFGEGNSNWMREFIDLLNSTN